VWLEASVPAGNALMHHLFSLQMTVADVQKLIEVSCSNATHQLQHTWNVLFPP